ncbi:glycosyl transferase [Salinimicrobium marinum]|uniref:Glycosyl transferase n=1 Tax=Salinimicrobium marinum TaxID=680283 RepID=A0A918SM27_9FLAO|nr:glycosyltransferase family 2 protein [Salinimicrobium marinum]GHA50417.1 glycosyl transferase [Salinimicrobium marinum]
MKIVVSIIIPTYNRANLLRETLISVSKQKLANWECIIVDDGSEDHTRFVVREFTDADKRFNYYERPSSYKKGASSCRNYGFLKSQGEYIQWLDDDDLMSENKLASQVQTLKSYESAIATCDWDILWPGKKYFRRNLLIGKDNLTPKEYFEELRKQQTFVPPHTFLAPRYVVEKAGLWHPNLTLNDDAEFFARVILQAKKVVSSPNCHVLYREHDGDRLSHQINSNRLYSLLDSLRLIHSHLKSHDIVVKPFFKWKLLRILLNNWETEKKVLQQYRSFFKENGINTKFANAYLLKYKLYKVIYPQYKKYIKMKRPV